MTIRLKILSLAFILLLIFGIVIGVSALLQHQFLGELEVVAGYEVPLRSLIADFDVLTDEYELIPMRLLRRIDASQEEIERDRAHAHEVAQRMTEDVRRLDAIIDQAIADPRDAEQGRVILAGLKGALPFIERQLNPFIKIGERVLQAIAEGDRDRARNLSLEFRNTEQAFGPDTSAMRRKLTELAEAYAASIRGKEATIEFLSYLLFAFAACLGIGAGILVSAHIVSALRRLADGARAVQAGEVMVAVPVGGNDEIAQLAIAFNRMVEEIRSRERIKDAFGKFVDPRLVAGLIAAASGDMNRAERQVVTVFFSDIADFTSISEELTAAAMVNLLNHYFTAVTTPIRDNNGLVDKYIGDGVMGFWAAPFSPGDTHAASACLSALEQQTAIETLNADLPNLLGLRRAAPKLHVRMGLATGEAVVGTIGSTVSKSYTVIGDTVNLASRLEGVNKIYGTRIIIAEETLRLARQEIETRELDLITVAGKSEPVRIYELLGRSDRLSPALAELASEFEKGLAAYRSRDWDGAERQFQRCLEMNPADGPSNLYIERLAKLRRTPPPVEWDGVWRLSEKVR